MGYLLDNPASAVGPNSTHFNAQLNRQYPVYCPLLRIVPPLRQRAQIGPFSHAEVVVAVPGTSAALVKKVLAGMRGEGKLTLDGRGRGARWRVVN